MILEEAYKQIIDHIVVTDEMRQRILKKIENTPIETEKKRRLRPVYRYCAAAACVVLVAVGALTLPHFRLETEGEAPSGVQSGVLDATQASSLEELSELVGFSVEPLTDLPFSLLETEYTAFNKTLAQVTYRGESQQIVFRKREGEGDPSGDYTQYADTLTIEIGGVSVALKGDGGNYALAHWQDGRYAYSVKASAALSAAEWEKMLQAVCATK